MTKNKELKDKLAKYPHVIERTMPKFRGNGVELFSEDEYNNLKEIVEKIKAKLTFWEHSLVCEINFNKEIPNQMAIDSAQDKVDLLKELLKTKEGNDKT